MTDKEVIERLEWVRKRICDITYSPESFEAINLAIKACKERPQDKWIPVSERLPEETLNSVIGWDTYREKCVFVQFIDGHFQITGKDESFNIVAWQPLPEPYKER